MSERESAGTSGWLVTAVLVAVAVLLPLTAAAAGVDVDPKRLVLRTTDLPAGFVPDPRSTLPLPNERVIRRTPALRSLVERSGRVNGRVSGYRKPIGDGRAQFIASTVDLCRRPDGARVLFRWHDSREKADNAGRARRGEQLFRHERGGVGAVSMIYLSGPPDYSIRVLWVQGRVLASVWTWGLGRKTTLELAHTQQRRIGRVLG